MLQNLQQLPILFLEILCYLLQKLKSRKQVKPVMLNYKHKKQINFLLNKL